MFSGLRVQGPQTSVDATSISDLKNLKALHNNEDITITIRLNDFIELVESLGAGEGEDDYSVEELLNTITDMENEIEELEQDLSYTTENEDVLEMDIFNLEQTIEELEAELVSVHSELDEAHAMIDDNE